VSTESETGRRPTTKAFAIVAILVCLVLAGVVSFYASSQPDGLNKVAADKGLTGNEQQSAASGSPLAGYATEDVDDERLGGGLAGVVGVASVLLIAGGVAFAVRRRTPADETVA
jgi:cobalt/nickel transport protein